MMKQKLTVKEFNLKKKMYLHKVQVEGDMAALQFIRGLLLTFRFCFF